ncbi:MAG: oxalurate catabolism protein HpxZ [Pseudomonadota bacterium]|uniref:DUF4440 domain-containing protein n=1 Tax=Caballeronia sordidicola TaxID=196367 RepID=A0A242NA67_CABSO|nr:MULTISPECIES: oxalurate catabolism protein HpxZ [Burkholderiaceae]AMM17414.1 DUF4440 domain-containing protein [Burkholderia sp. PAMC 28687]MDP9153442.1 oxalurate catabolism protein HpxZ [Pseudomonadota bacterium]OTP80046.1 hypothetical protein PAMC26510_04540 [Caballeronia sordidicola]
MTLPINQPEVIAQVCAAFVEYERALVANDIETMNALFWNATETVRYGIAEIQHGGDAIRQWRETCAPVPASRKLHRTIVTTFGADFATVSTEFTSDTTPLIGRQMQSWARIGDDGDWKIVAAHVSLIPEP